MRKMKNCEGDFSAMVYVYKNKNILGWRWGVCFLMSEENEDLFFVWL